MVEIALSPYIPMDRRLALARGLALPDRATGAVLFVDFAGFTKLTQILTAEFGRKAGAEEVLRLLNPVYDALITVLHNYQGSVIGFAGDSITCWFDERPVTTIEQNVTAAPLRAVAGAQAMHEAMTSFATVQTPNGTEIQLMIKIAMAAGPVRRFLVGDPDILKVDTLAGQTLERMTAAEHQASPGETVVSEEVITLLNQDTDPLLPVLAWRTEEETGRRFAITGPLNTAVPTAPWPEMRAAELPAEVARPWLLKSLYDILESGPTLLGDLRMVTPLFLNFSGIDFDGDDDAGQKLDAYICWVQQTIARYGGHFIQLTIGDKGAFLYSAFGAPIAHEDDRQRALSAALVLQEPPAELDYIGPVQMGLSHGNVFTGICGGARRHTYGVMGADVNLSARLMMQAQPGQILISSALSQAPSFQMTPLGKFNYKGFAQPIQTYRLTGRSDDRPLFADQMTGRQAELQQMLDFAQPIFGVGSGKTAGSPRFAGVAIIYGEPGIGKSRLSYELRRQLDATNVLWRTAQADQILRQPFNAFTYLLKQYFRQVDMEDESLNKRRYEQQLQKLIDRLDALEKGDIPTYARAVPAAARRSLVAEIRRTFSFPGALLGLHWPDSLYEKLDAESRYQNTLIAVKALLLGESMLRPVILEVEDGHWLDPASAELLTAISRQVAAYPLFILITSRYHDDGARPAYRLAEDIPRLELDLNVLEPDESRTLAAALLGGPPDDKLHHFLLEKSEANPFFTQQILRYLKENELLIQTVGSDDAPPQWTLTGAEVELPGSISTLLIARIDRLVVQARQVVQAAAVLGREFEVRLLGHLLQKEVGQEVQQAVEEQIWNSLNKLRYLFTHALLRDAAYEMQLRARLRQLHQQAAAAHEQLYAHDLPAHYGEIAYHYETAYTLGNEAVYEQAVHFLELAGQQAAARYENEAGVEYFSRALALAPAEDTPLRYRLTLAREKLYHVQGNREAQARDLAKLEALATADRDLFKQAETAVRRGWYANATGNYDLAVETLTQFAALEAMAEPEIPVQSEAWAAGDPALAASFRQLAEAQQARRLALQADLNTARTVKASKDHYIKDKIELLNQMTLGLQELAKLHESGRVPSFLASIRTEDDLASVASSLKSRERFLFDPIKPEKYVSSELLVDVFEQTVSWFQTISLPFSDKLRQYLYNKPETGRLAAQMLVNAGYALTQQGQVETARSHFKQALYLARQTQAQVQAARALGGLGHVAHRLGGWPPASTYHRQALLIRRQTGDRSGEALSLINLAGLRLAALIDETPQEYLQQALDIFREIGNRQGQGLALNGLGDVAREVGQYQAAQDFHQQALAISREIGDRQGEGQSLRALGQNALFQIALDEAHRYCAEALVIFQEIKDQLGQGQTLTALGQEAHHRGDLVAARRYFEEAAVLFEQISATDEMYQNQEHLALVARDRGDYESAQNYLDQLPIMAVNSLADLDRTLGNFRRAQSRYRQSLGEARMYANPRQQLLYLLRLGQVAPYQRRAKQGITFAEKALAIARELGLRFFEAAAQVTLGNALVELAQWPEAVAALQESLELLRPFNLQYTVEAQSILAQALAGQGRAAAAESEAQKAAAYLLDGGSLTLIPERLRVYLTCYRLLPADSAAATQILESAHQILTRQAATITDPALYSAYLKKIPWHQAIIAAHQSR